MERLELSKHKLLGPKSSASTNSATPAIYKCAPLAYLPMTADMYNLSDKWSHYLTYSPITPDCTDEELQEFFNRKAESFCGMCPKNPQLLSRQNDPRLPKKHYEKIPLQVVK